MLNPPALCYDVHIDIGFFRCYASDAPWRGKPGGPARPIDWSLDILGSETSLLSQMTAYLKNARSLGKRIEDMKDDFSLQLRLDCPATDEGIDFPWYDSLADMQPLFAWLNDTTTDLANGNNTHFSDSEQHWAVAIERVGNRLQWRQSDPDRGDIQQAFLSTPLHVTHQALHNARERMEHILDYLAPRLGVDPWRNFRFDIREAKWIYEDKRN